MRRRWRRCGRVRAPAIPPPLPPCRRWRRCGRVRARAISPSRLAGGAPPPPLGSAGIRPGSAIAAAAQLGWEKKTEWREKEDWVGRERRLSGEEKRESWEGCNKCCWQQCWVVIGPRKSSKQQKRLFSNLSWDKPELMPSPIFVNRGWHSLVIPSILAWVSFCLKTFQRTI